MFPAPFGLAVMFQSVFTRIPRKLILSQGVGLSRDTCKEVRKVGLDRKAGQPPLRPLQLQWSPVNPTGSSGDRVAFSVVPIEATGLVPHSAVITAAA